MKAILLSIAILAMGSLAKANITFCSYGEINNIVNYDQETFTLSARALNDSEVKLLQSYVDDSWNCEEGVELIGPEKDENGASYKAVCYADSLGSATVSLKLSCE
ncbi:MAG: hypothetical protein HRT44_13765 [Bdellovibrionales bacterium]|nr:hypothetical protein [Bdellovibrionales bacterium]